MRTGYSAIADEWVAIRPGTDGLFVLSLVHELLKAGRVDLDFLVRYTNAGWLVIDDAGAADHGLFARDERVIRCPSTGTAARSSRLEADIAPSLNGAVDLPDGRRAVPAFQLMTGRYLDARFAPEAVARHTGLSAAQIKRIAANWPRRPSTRSGDRPTVDRLGRPPT